VAFASSLANETIRADSCKLVSLRGNQANPKSYIANRKSLGLIIVQDFNDSTVRCAHPVFARNRLKMHRDALGPFL
jgi:hypothetical protein